MNARKFILMAFASFLGTQTLVAQEKLTTIAAPSSPAAYILGAQPSSVLAPKSFQALETSLFSNFINKDGKTVLPNDFALEFTPYWATDHGLTLEDYLYPRNVFDQWWRNSSFSVASTQSFVLEDKTNSSGLSFGYRTNFFIGGKHDRDTIAILTEKLRKRQRFTAHIAAQVAPLLVDSSVKDVQTFLRRIMPVIETKLKDIYGAEIQGVAFSKLKSELETGAQLLSYKDKSTFENDFYNLVEDKVRKVYNMGVAAELFKDYIKAREGFSFDIAYAGFLNFPNNQFNYSFAPRHSAWLTPTYTFRNKAGSLKLMGVLRYEWYDTDYYTKYFPSSKTYKNNFDYGIAVAADFDRFALQLEAIGRYDKTETKVGTDTDGSILFKRNSSSDFQCVGSFSYKINKQIAVSYSLGSGFESIINPGNTLVSLLSLNLGFGGPTTNTVNK